MPIPLKNKEFALLGCEETTGVWYINKGGEWQAIGLENHSHPELGDINFTGTVSVGGVVGLNLNTQEEIKKITNLVIVNGLITEFEYEV